MATTLLPVIQRFAGVKPAPGRAYVLKERLGLADPTGGRSGAVDEAAMCAEFVITTDSADRVGDVVNPQGIVLDSFRTNPIAFYGHQVFPLPIGRWADANGNCTIALEKHRATGTLYFSRRSKEAAQVFALVAEGILRACSIGFNPLAEPVPRDRGDSNEQSLQSGYYFPRVDLLEVSVVGIPAQAEATLVRECLSRNRLAGAAILAPIRKSLEALAEPVPVWSNGATLPRGETVRKVIQTARKEQSGDVVRWNRSLSKAFDVELQASRPASEVYAWVSKHIGCKVKELSQWSKAVPAARLGSFLTGLQIALADCDLKDVRNLTGNGSEVPPTYEYVQLSSTRYQDFLVSGMAFYESAAGKFVLEYSPSYRGLEITLFAEHAKQDFGRALIDRASEWAKANNFLKGEAFSLSGEFLPRTREDWPDVILEEKNKTALSRTVDLFNEKGSDFPNRGVILTGPPGTGKTLSSRIVRNQAKGSFIWISSRDFHYSGSFGGLSFGFEMARELAPAVLCIEDVDNWLYDTSVDLIKTEMDGIARSSGVLTILTTNFPERIPEALIDRPGRFHDVLKFGLPTLTARRTMLAKWLPELASEEIERAAKKTEGYSGAHLYELAHFAGSLREHDGLEAVAAVREALHKVEEQRELITELQLSGSSYRLRKEVEAMSKKWGKTKPRAKLALPQVKAKPTATKASAKPSLEECVTKKAGKLLGDGMPHAEALAAAFAECGDDKAMGESSGTAGGYTVNGEHDDEENKALTAAIISLTERVDKAATAARKRKKLPPPPGTPDAELPGDEAGDQQEQPPPPPPQQQQVQPNPKGDPREVLTQLVDALTAYLDLTTAKPDSPMVEDDEEEEEEDDEEDADNQDVEEGGTEADQTTGDERYQFRATTPKREKAAKGKDEDPAMNKRCKSVCKAAARHLKEMGDMDDDAPIKSMHKAASHYHRKELEGLVKDMGDDGEDETVQESEDDGGESDAPAAPVNKRGQKAMVEEESIDLTQILKALRPVEERVVAVGNAWANLNGTMP